MKFIRLCSRRAPQFEESPCFWAISTLDIHMSSPMVASRPPKMEVGNNKCNKEGSRLISKENRPFPTGMIVGNGSFCGYSTYHDLVFRWPKPLYIFHGKWGLMVVCPMICYNYPPISFQVDSVAARTPILHR